MRIALGIDYNGQDFHGWQRQQNLSTVQGHLEEALSRIADAPITIICAGRTDAGVHASGQVIHFDVHNTRNTSAWIRGTNTYLPPTISVRWVKEVDDNFHARFSALNRKYRYIIHNHPIRSALLASKATWHRQPINANLMHEAAQYLIGEHDFSSFRATQCESKSPIRHIQSVSVVRRDQFVILEIQANAFLHHMVRNITGSLIKVGEELKKPSWIQELIEIKDRKAAAETAPPSGLYLINVEYPDNFQIPSMQNCMLFL